MRVRAIVCGVAAMLLVIAAAGAPFSRKAKEAPLYSKPAENILIIVADLHRHLNDDIYRFAYPVDVTGQNVFRATLVRLANYETLFPGKMKDVVALAKAQAFEKMSSYQEAGRNYQLAQKSDDENIKRLATDGFERTKKFSAAVDQEIDKSALRTFQRDMEKKIRDLDDLAQQFRKTPYESIALLERERAQLQLAQFFIAMRFMQPYSTNDAIVQIKRNIDQNKDSKLLYQHHLMLGDMYYDLANEYTLLNDPEGPSFRLRDFEGFSNAARSEYHIVQRADGFAEKLEARAKLMALEAFVQRVSERAR
jgi:hypothetical protein